MRNVDQDKLLDMLIYLKLNSMTFIFNHNKSYNYKKENKYRQNRVVKQKLQEESVKNLMSKQLADKYLCSPENFSTPMEISL